MNTYEMAIRNYARYLQKRARQAKEQPHPDEHGCGFHCGVYTGAIEALEGVAQDLTNLADELSKQEAR